MISAESKSRALTVARRVYGDLVRRRSSVRIVDAQSVDDDLAIHFVLGLYRSGTTALRYSMASHPSVAAPPESDFLAPLLSVFDDDRSGKGLRAMGFDRPSTDRQLRRLATYFYGNYARSLDASVVLDKTPSYVYIAENIAAVFPSARYVLLYRNPFGQIGSLTTGLRHIPAVTHFEMGDGQSLADASAQFWLDGVGRLVRFQQSHPDACISVPYESLCRDPEPWLRAITEHLGLTYDDSVLSYDASTIDVGKEGGKAAGHSGFVDRPVSVDNWDPQSIASVRDATSALAEILGYTFLDSAEVTPTEFNERVKVAAEFCAD